MNKHPRILAALVALCLAFSTSAQASGTPHLENGLAQAMRLDPKTKQRLGDSGKAIRAYKRAGIVGQKPDQRADYTDYYLLKKPASFMGHGLVVIEEEYMSAHVGCCVSKGVGITVEVVGDTKNLADFAAANGCTLSDRVDLKSQLDSVGIQAAGPVRGQAAHHASLSCRERDAD